MLRITDVARQLNCSDDTVRRLIDRGELPAVRWGRFLRFKQADIDTFIEKHTTGGPENRR